MSLDDFYASCAIPKVTRPKAQKPVQPIQRLRKRKTKPVTRERRKRALERVYAEREAKAEVRERDQTCRWPGCTCQRSWGSSQANSWMRGLEVAHLEDKGMGGDKKLIRTQRHKMILICGWRHRGTFGLHSGRARIVPLNAEKGTDGPCEFWLQRQKNGEWELVGLG
jgi:hypothetical protein